MQSDASNPFKKGNALKDKNFNKFCFHVLWIAVLSLFLIAGAAWLL